MKVTVVGAGIIGCAVAYELARRGARVHVVDPRTPGQGATRASAGILAPYIEGHVPSLLKLGVRSLALYDDFVQRAGADGATDIEYERCGTLQVAAADAETIRLAALARELAQARVVHRLFDRNEVREIEPHLSPQRAQRAAHPLARLRDRRLARGGARGGGHASVGVVFETATVTQVGSAAAGACVHTSNGRIEGDAAVMAAGSWSPLIPVRAGPRGGVAANREARRASGARTARPARSGGAGGASRRVGARLLRGAAP